MDAKDTPMDFTKLMADRKAFNNFVYTPLSVAIRELEARQKDQALIAKIEELLHGDVPDILKNIGMYGISPRQVATPNFDTLWFIELTQNHGLKTVFFEYLSDKFASKNTFKHSLGQLQILGKKNKKGERIEEKITIINFNEYNGKELRNIKTLWGENLIDFHKGLFKLYDIKNLDEIVFYDESDWLKRNGGNAENYYARDMLLYICHGILFENFLLSGDDGDFTKNIFLPAFENICRTLNIKPLVVPIPPIETEDSIQGMTFDSKIKANIKL